MTAFTKITLTPIVSALLAMAAWPVASSFGEDSYDERLSAIRQTIREDYPSVRQITTQELADWLADTSRLPPLLLDVRTEDEYRVSHLKNAQHMTQQMPISSVTDELAAGQAVVVYCSVGVRSSDLAVQLAQAGLEKVYNLDGSIFQWANESRPLYSGNHTTHLVHPYNRKWGRCLKKELHGKAPSPQKGTR
jgi:rhodanese-related sulfurtransferase